MTKNPKGKSAKRPRPPTPRELVEAEQAMLDLVNRRVPPDLTLALVIQLTARLEQGLRLLLQLHMDTVPTSTTEKLLDPMEGGALSTGSARNDACRAFSFISERCHSDIKTVFNVRNIFAHHYLPLTFDNPYVKKECDKLTMYRPAVFAKIPSGLREALEPREEGFRSVALAIGTDIIRWVHWERPGLGGEMLPVDPDAPVAERGEKPKGMPFRAPWEHFDETRLFGP